LRRISRGSVVYGLIALGAFLTLHKPAAKADPPLINATRPAVTAGSATPQPDFSGATRFGKASFYANFFGGRKMANGARMDLNGSNAASRTLPLGTTAKVTNLETGRSAVVIIEDRGPYVDGRIVDLSPATARKIGITRRKGVSEVAVTPITVPLPDGRVMPGAALDELHSGGLLASD
jgi:rare lipoprotein A